MKNLLLFILIPIICFGQEDVERYKLYPTQNMYTFLKLDSSNGLVWQVQYGVGDVVSSEVVLSSWKISNSVEEITQEYNEEFEYWEEVIKKDPKLSTADIENWKPISLEKRLANKSIAKNGRYKLYPTQNIYNFILLDVINGRVFQVQWNIDEKKRIVQYIH